MPAAIVSVIATDSDVLGGVTAVTLSNAAGSYGIRNKATGEVAVAAGTPLINTSQGLWEYEFSRDDAEIYECSLKITDEDGGIRYLTQEIFAAEVPISVSDNEEPELVRNLDVTKTDVERVFIEGRGEFLHYTITASNEVLMPRHIFAHMKLPGDPKAGTPGDEHFHFVATPFDVTFFPDGYDPEQIPGYYRKDTIEVYAPSSEVAKFVWDSISEELDGLIANYGRMDRLYPVAEVILDGSGDLSDIPVDPLPDPEDDPVSCAVVTTDDQLVLYDELADATGDTVSISEG